MKKLKLKKGFTLIELLVVVAIIAILALIVLLALNPVEMARRSRDSRRLSDLGTLRRAIDLSLADGKTLTAKGATTMHATTNVKNIDGSGLDISKYLSAVPQDPMETAINGTLTTDGTNCTVGTPGTATIPSGSMVYTYQSDGDTYFLDGYLESTSNCSAVANDGNADNKYEIGTAPGLTYAAAPTPTP